MTIKDIKSRPTRVKNDRDKKNFIDVNKKFNVFGAISSYGAVHFEIFE